MMIPSSMVRVLVRSTLAFATGCLLVAAGCGGGGPATGTVRGKVTLNDAPYTQAMVVFMSLTTGVAGSGDIQADGAFELKTPLPVGEYRVFLAPKSSGSDAQPTPVSIDKSVPDRYWNETTTDITAQIKAGKNEVPVAFKK